MCNIILEISGNLDSDLFSYWRTIFDLFFFYVCAACGSRVSVAVRNFYFAKMKEMHNNGRTEEDMQIATCDSVNGNTKNGEYKFD